MLATSPENACEPSIRHPVECKNISQHYMGVTPPSLCIIRGHAAIVLHYPGCHAANILHYPGCHAAKVSLTSNAIAAQLTFLR